MQDIPDQGLHILLGGPKLLCRSSNLFSISDSSGYVGQAEPSSQTAYQIFWCTGTLSGPITSGFYSIVVVASYCLDGHPEVSGRVPGVYNTSRKQTQKAMSLP